MKMSSMIIVILFSALFGCQTESSDILVVPEGYTGYVVIVYGQETGEEEQKVHGSRVYQIPESGIHKTRREYSSGWSELPKVYEGDMGKGQIPFEHDLKKLPETGKVAYGGSSGYLNRDLEKKPPIRFMQYYIGNKAQIKKAIDDTEGVKMSELLSNL